MRKPPPKPSDPQFFATPAAFRAWLAQHHGTATELVVGFHKVGSKLASMTWPESVDEALCFGWIDGVRKSLGETSYSIRFSPRRERSIWSDVNIQRAIALETAGRMKAAGRKAFAARTEDKSRVYSFEQGEVSLSPAYEQQLKANEAAWHDLQGRAPWYRRKAYWWVMSAKQAATQQRRLEKLIALHEAGEMLM